MGKSRDIMHNFLTQKWYNSLCSRLPGPADLFKELQHGHLVPLLGMGSSPGSLSGNLKHRRRTSKRQTFSKEEAQRAEGERAIRALPPRPSGPSSSTGCWSPTRRWGSTWKGRSLWRGKTFPVGYTSSSSSSKHSSYNHQLPTYRNISHIEGQLCRILHTKQRSVCSVAHC